MARTLRLFSALATVALIASTSIVRRAIETVDYFIRFVFASVAPAPAFALAGPASECSGGSIRPFANLLVERHEAGQGRRAAARGI